MRFYNLFAGFFSYFTIFFALLSFKNLEAQPLYVAIKANGSENIQAVSTENPSSKMVSFYFVSSGNITNILYMGLTAPENTVASMRARFMGKDSIEEALAANSGWYDLNFITSQERTKSSYLFSSTAQATINANGLMDCSSITLEKAYQIIEVYRIQFGKTLTLEELCGDTKPIDSDGGNPSVTPTPNGGSGNINGNTIYVDYLRSYLSKDTCTAKSASKYLVEIRFDLSRVSTDILAAGSSVGITITERPHQGKMAASIKPKSDGRYAPKPLLLMTSPGAYLTLDKIDLVQWKKGKLRSRKTLKYAKGLYYKGLFLSGALLDGVLKGGKGSFEITNGSSAYSVCMKLVRTRQRVNGYP